MLPFGDMYFFAYCQPINGFPEVGITASQIDPFKPRLSHHDFCSTWGTSDNIAISGPGRTSTERSPEWMKTAASPMDVSNSHISLPIPFVSLQDSSKTSMKDFVVRRLSHGVPRMRMWELIDAYND